MNVYDCLTVHQNKVFVYFLMNDLDLTQNLQNVQIIKPNSLSKSYFCMWLLKVFLGFELA